MERLVKQTTPLYMNLGLLLVVALGCFAGEMALLGLFGSNRPTYDFIPFRPIAVSVGFVTLALAVMWALRFQFGSPVKIEPSDPSAKKPAGFLMSLTVMF